MRRNPCRGKNRRTRAFRGVRRLAVIFRGALQDLTHAHTKFWPRYSMERAAPVAIINRPQFEPDARELFI